MHGGDQYDTFASDYEWLFSDATLSGDPQVDALKAILGTCGGEPRILDCACGTGLTALALARRGYSVIGTDASAGMVTRAREHAAEARLHVALRSASGNRFPVRSRSRLTCCSAWETRWATAAMSGKCFVHYRV